MRKQPHAWRCPDCGRPGTDLKEAHCAACHRHFTSVSAFDAHQRIDHKPCGKAPENQGENPHKVCDARSVCLDPATLHKPDGSPVLVQVETACGPVWANPGMPAEAIAALKRSHA
jgi:hypothetical protein